MKTTTVVSKSLIALIAATFLSPCLAAGPGIKDAPQWVNTGTAYETLQGKRLFHGVGAAPASNDSALQKATAEKRARQELHRLLTTYLNDLTSEYKTTAAGDTGSTPEDKASAQLTSLAKPALKEAKIVAHWRDKRTGTLYALIDLDLNEVKRVAAKRDNVSQDTQEYIKEYGDIVFDSESQYVEY